MKACNIVRRVGARFVNDNSGSMAMAWGVSLVAIVFAVGSAFDASQASKAKQLAQSAADNMALAASIAVDRGNQEKFTEGHPYTYAEIGGPTEDFTGTMTGKVEYDVQDGDDKLIARATITGTYSTAFMSIIGVDGINLKAVSDVAYAESGGSPASVFFVADNSGSMGDTDSTGVQKLSSLETSMKNFMTTLNGLDDDGTADTFRTALYPFSADPYNYYSYINSDGVIPSHTVDPAWGTISNGNITRMYDRYGTDSSGALQDAADDFDLENAAHMLVNNESDPLKFLVFMTDGANNSSYECSMQEVTYPASEEYWLDTYYYPPVKYTSYQNWFDGWVDYYPASPEYTQEEQVCGYDYYFDERSLEACTQMKDSGVKVYAISYDVAASEKARAEAFLQACSSGDEYFKSATDATALEAAFEEIGTSIVEEVIRIKR